MNTLNQEFIEKVKEHESNFLKDKILVQTKEDWDALKNNLYYLATLYVEEEKESVLVKNCQDYLRLMWKSMHMVEAKYGENLNESNISQISQQLKTLCLFYQPIFVRNELAEKYETEKNENVPYLDVTDILNKNYRIKKEDGPLFESLCNAQIKLNTEYEEAYTCIYGNREQKIKLLDSYIKDALDLKMSFLNGQIQIMNREKWDTLKEKVNLFKKKSDHLHQNLEVTEKFKVTKNVDEKFVDFIANYIEKIEERYHGNISTENLVSIMENLYTLCKYNHLVEEKDKIIFSTKKSQEKEEKTEVITSSGIVVSIAKDKAEAWKNLDIEQKKLQEKYKEAISFAFGDTMEEEAKRGM